VAGRDDTCAVLSICGAEADGNTISASLLAKSITAVQDIAYDIGADLEERKYGKRLRKDHKLKQQYTIRAGIPEPGSYTLPLYIGQDGALVSEFAQVIFPRIWDIFDAVASGSKQRLTELFDDDRFLGRAITTIKDVMPRPSDKWSIGFKAGSRKLARIEGKQYKAVYEWVRQTATPQDEITVTGELIKMDFEEKKVVIRHPAAKRTIECDYDEENEPRIIDQRRQLVQVTGTFKLDHEGYPTKAVSIERIEEVDMSELWYESISHENRVLAFNPPLVLTPAMDEATQQLYVVKDDQLGIHAFAYTREELKKDLQDQLFFLWDSYAKENDEVLSPAAKDLKQNLKDRIREK